MPHERFRLSGNAIVTGGAGDLGFAASRALLEYGVEGPMVFDANPTEAEVEGFCAGSRVSESQYPIPEGRN